MTNSTTLENNSPLDTARRPLNVEAIDLLRVMGKEHLAADPRFATPQLRFEHSAEINAFITEWSLQRDKYECMRRWRRRFWADNEDVYGGLLSLSADEIAAMKAENVI